MPNTTIQLKKSSTPSSKPTDLANGELAINFADGKLYYKNIANYVVEYTSSQSNDFGTVSANGTLLVADTTGDVLTMSVGNNITIVGDAVNDKVTIGLSNDVSIPGKLNVLSDFSHLGGAFYINNAGGAGGSSEGGEIQLANATSATQGLSGRVSIDIYESKLRFFETNSPNRGAFINLASATAGVGSDLLAAASATDTLARATASAAFDKANAANVLAFNALPNTNGITFNGTLLASANFQADKIISTNNGNGENFKIGDDAWIGDTNLANAFRIKGQQNTAMGYILFGTNDGKLLGRAGTDVLTWDGVTIPTISSTNTLTNKRITPRISVTAAQSSPMVWNSDSFDQYVVNTLGNILTINADSGSPSDGQKILFRFKPNTTGVTLTWTTGSANSFRAIGMTLPTSLTSGKTTYVGAVYNAIDSRWDTIATASEA